MRCAHDRTLKGWDGGEAALSIGRRARPKSSLRPKVPGDAGVTGSNCTTHLEAAGENVNPCPPVCRNHALTVMALCLFKCHSQSV